MGTLYIVGAPATGPEDLTFRARRILGSAALVVAADEERARRFLAGCDIWTSVGPAAPHHGALAVLASDDVALLLPGGSASPGPAEQGLVAAAVAGGFAVVPVPGPVVPLTALVLSGLPAEGFVYLGVLPRQAGARRALLESMAAEPRTLVLLAPAGKLHDVLSALHSAWGPRPLALWPATSGSGEGAWRGSLEEALEGVQSLDAGGDWVLVAAGAPREAGAPWPEDRLREAIRAHLQRGLSVGQISRELAGPSGWPRREVYRLVLEEGGAR